MSWRWFKQQAGQVSVSLTTEKSLAWVLRQMVSLSVSLSLSPCLSLCLCLSLSVSLSLPLSLCLCPGSASLSDGGTGVATRAGRHSSNSPALSVTGHLPRVWTEGVSEREGIPAPLTTAHIYRAALFHLCTQSVCVRHDLVIGVWLSVSSLPPYSPAPYLF